MKYQPTPEVVARIIESEAVVLDTVSGHYYTLNVTATTIWSGVEEGLGVGEIARALAQRYGIDEGEAVKDVHEQVEYWLSEGLIAEQSS